MAVVVFHLRCADRVLVSACLLGERCRYDGANKRSAATAVLIAQCRLTGIVVVPVCPEVLGGLGVPRPPAHLVGGDGHGVLRGNARVVTCADQRDVTAAFVAGARLAWEQAAPARLAILKARSPSCGVGQTEIEGRVQPGHGVLAAQLDAARVDCFTDEDLERGNVRVELDT